MSAGGCLLFTLMMLAILGLIIMPIAALLLVVPWAAVGWYYVIFIFAFIIIGAT